MTERKTSTSENATATARVEIYSTDFCGYCVRAKALLDTKGVAYTEHAIDRDDSARAEMLVRANGRRSVPQIFINGQGIGGYMELYALERSGELDSLLVASS